MIVIKILVACEESQRVTIELRKLGHEAYSCDIEPCSGGHPEWHLQQDVLPLLEEKWDMIIAFPPCTYLTAAGACRMYPTKGCIDTQRLEKAQEARQFFLTILQSNCPRIAVENPRPLRVVNLPKESQRIQPWQFGDAYTKLTYLWLKNLPPLIPTHDLQSIAVPYVCAGTFNSKGEKRQRIGIKHSALERSKTFHGIAKAMAEQWAGVSERTSERT